MKLPKRKTFLWMGLVTGFAGLGGWTLLRGHSDIEYRTAVVDRGNVASTISATGSPNAVVTVQVGTQVSGNILALFADFNSTVKKGQLVARIDPHGAIPGCREPGRRCRQSTRPDRKARHLLHRQEHRSSHERRGRSDLHRFPDRHATFLPSVRGTLKLEPGDGVGL